MKVKRQHPGFNHVSGLDRASRELSAARQHLAELQRLATQDSLSAAKAAITTAVIAKYESELVVVERRGGEK